jgi:hypothetical protein
LRRFGAGWLGINDVPLARAKPRGSGSNSGIDPNDHIEVQLISAPLLGVRYWLTTRFGLDAGFGIAMSGGTTKSKLGSVSQDVDRQKTLALVFHAGVPIGVYSTDHMALIVVPEATWSMARSTVAAQTSVDPPEDVELRGSRLDLGARAGAEIFFGFVKLPRLSLEGSFGLFYSRQVLSAWGSNQSVTDRSYVLRSTVFSSPWDLFRTAVAARYYF